MRLPTRYKIYLASLLARVVIGARRLGGRGPDAMVCRRGLLWGLDLREGIDFAQWLGIYEADVTAVMRGYAARGSVILDIGANIGVHALPAAAAAAGASGTVVAIEPTDFAFRKMQRNASLNPGLAPKLILRQCFLIGRGESQVAPDIYSSWPLVSNGKDCHPLHRGVKESASGADAVTLDALVDELKLERIDLLKLDVDGYEESVISGGVSSIGKFKPDLIIELAPYAHESRPIDGLILLLNELGYVKARQLDGTPLDLNMRAIHAVCPHGAGINVLASPS